MNFPEFYPENCPPDEANKPDGVYFRLVKGTTVVKEDFVPKAATNPHNFTGFEHCKACGLSLLSRMSAVLKMKKIYKGFRDCRVASAHLGKNHGLLLETPHKHNEHHTTWWVPVNIRPWEMFTINVEF